MNFILPSTIISVRNQIAIILAVLLVLNQFIV